MSSVIADCGRLVKMKPNELQLDLISVVHILLYSSPIIFELFFFAGRGL